MIEDIGGLSVGSDECLSIPIHWASFFASHLEMITLLLKRAPDSAKIPTNGPHQHNALHISASQGSMKVVQKIVEICPQAATVKDQDGEY